MFRIMNNLNKPIELDTNPSCSVNVRKLENVRLKIVEGPAQRNHRFRYKSEGRPASIAGINSTVENPTLPAFQIEGYDKVMFVIISCVTNKLPHRPHPYRLVGNNCNDGVCTIHLYGSPMQEVLSKLGIQCVLKKDMHKELQSRYKLKINAFHTKFDANINTKEFDHNVVRLCFQGVIPIPGPKEYFLIPPVVSEPIYSKRSANDLAICRLCSFSAKATGGDTLFLFCDEVAKKDIEVRFYEETSNWIGLGEFEDADVHRRVCIALKTPRYKDPDIKNGVKVKIQLYRPSDGKKGEPRDFEFRPDPENFKRRRVSSGDCPSALVQKYQQIERNKTEYSKANSVCNAHLPTSAPSLSDEIPYIGVNQSTSTAFWNKNDSFQKPLLPKTTTSHVQNFNAENPREMNRPEKNENMQNSQEEAVCTNPFRDNFPKVQLNSYHVPEPPAYIGSLYRNGSEQFGHRTRIVNPATLNSSPGPKTETQMFYTYHQSQTNTNQCNRTMSTNPFIEAINDTNGDNRNNVPLRQTDNININITNRSTNSISQIPTMANVQHPYGNIVTVASANQMANNFQVPNTFPAMNASNNLHQTFNINVTLNQYQNVNYVNLNETRIITNPSTSSAMNIENNLTPEVIQEMNHYNGMTQHKNFPAYIGNNCIPNAAQFPIVNESTRNSNNMSENILSNLDNEKRMNIQFEDVQEISELSSPDTIVIHRNSTDNLPYKKMKKRSKQDTSNIYNEMVNQLENSSISDENNNNKLV